MKLIGFSLKSDIKKNVFLSRIKTVYKCGSILNVLAKIIMHSLMYIKI